MSMPRTAHKEVSVGQRDLRGLYFLAKLCSFVSRGGRDIKDGKNRALRGFLHTNGGTNMGRAFECGKARGEHGVFF